MRLFGLYFTGKSGRIHDTSRSNTVTPDLAVSRKWNGGRIYAVVIMVVAWLNAVRLLSVFENTDKFGFVLFLKLTRVSAGLFTAVLNTACFVACQTGNLDGVFRGAKLPTSDLTRYRRLSIIHAIVIWVLLVVDVLIFVVPMIVLEKEMYMPMAPLGVHVFVSHQLRILTKIMASLMFILVDVTWYSSGSVNYMCYSKVLHCTG